MMKQLIGFLILSIIVSLNCFTSTVCASVASDHRLVVFVMDGVRRHEVFSGTDAAISKKPAQQPQQILSSLWSNITAPGAFSTQYVFGAFEKCVTGNSFQFSLPAYSEILSMRPQSSIFYSNVNSNHWKGKLHFETIADKAFKAGVSADEIALIAGWENIPAVFSKYKVLGAPAFPFYVDAGRKVTDTFRVTRPDQETFEAVKKYLQENDPRILFVVFNDTDDLGHKNLYEDYVQAIHNADSYTQRIKNILNAEVSDSRDSFFAEAEHAKKGYKNNTTFILTTDHGRGNKEHWKDHGNFYEGSENIWAYVDSTPSMLQIFRTQLKECNHRNLMALAVSPLGL